MDNERKHYIDLSPALAERIRKERQDIYLSEDLAIRRVRRPRDTASTLRPAFVRDAEKIMNCPYYNRYADKTQVFSFYKNDDISRRALHIQLVSRIARGIGYTLGLNLDLIEAIAIGHDLGHTPFGHVGERILSRIYNEKLAELYYKMISGETDVTFLEEGIVSALQCLCARESCETGKNIIVPEL